jgi:hypothetical protein
MVSSLTFLGVIPWRSRLFEQAPCQYLGLPLSFTSELTIFRIEAVVQSSLPLTRIETRMQPIRRPITITTAISVLSTALTLHLSWRQFVTPEEGVTIGVPIQGRRPDSLIGTPKPDCGVAPEA